MTLYNSYGDGEELLDKLWNIVFKDYTEATRSVIIGNILHESGNFKYTEEIWTIKDPNLPPWVSPNGNKYQRNYHKHPHLGNNPNVPNSGYLHRGRGLIQLTGYSNYKAFLKDRYSEANVELVSTPKMAIEACKWFINTRIPRDHITSLTNEAGVPFIVKRINGTKMLHYTERLKLSKIVFRHYSGVTNTLKED